MPVQPRIGSLCSGMGALDLAVMSVLGGSVAWHAELDPDAGRVLARHWPHVPNLGDLKAVDWDQVEPVDVLTAGYPCQPESNAGHRRSTEDDRWIWPHIADAVRHLRPRLVLLENVRGHVGRGLSTVVGDLAGLGYDARWGCVRADEIGGPHRRERVFIAASPADAGRDPWPGDDQDGAAIAGCGEDAAHAGGAARWTGDALTGDSGTSADRGGAPEPRGRAGAFAYAQGDRRHEGRPEPARHVGRPDAALGRGPAADADSDPVRQQPVAELGSVREAVSGFDGVDWGAYTAAIRRWEHILGRPAPAPTVTGARGSAVLNPQLPEWMLGLPPGWVTAVPGLSRSAQLRILGNGVCPQQGALALRLLLPAA